MLTNSARAYIIEISVSRDSRGHRIEFSSLTRVLGTLRTLGAIVINWMHYLSTTQHAPRLGLVDVVSWTL